MKMQRLINISQIFGFFLSYSSTYSLFFHFTLHPGVSLFIMIIMSYNTKSKLFPQCNSSRKKMVIELIVYTISAAQNGL